MPHDRRFRFGVQLHAATSAADWTAQARRAEDLGYSTIFIPDHFGDQLAPLPALTAAAATTTTIRVGTLVLDNDYRHPVVLAKELATLDVLSDGRLEIGIGSGWMRSDYDESGIPYDAPGVRVDRFAEGVQIIKGLLGPDPVTVEGEHYRVTNHQGLPKPVQQPHPPILIGGGKERMLRLAAREADIVGINPSIDSGQIDSDAARAGRADVTDQKLAWVRDEAGDRFDDLEINFLNFATIVTDERDQVAESMAPIFDLDPKEVTSYPHALIGSADQLTEDLHARRERWSASYVVVQAGSMDAFAPVVAALAGT